MLHYAISLVSGSWSLLSRQVPPLSLLRSGSCVRRIGGLRCPMTGEFSSPPQQILVLSVPHPSLLQKRVQPLWSEKKAYCLPLLGRLSCWLHPQLCLHLGRMGQFWNFFRGTCIILGIVRLSIATSPHARSIVAFQDDAESDSSSPSWQNPKNAVHATAHSRTPSLCVDSCQASIMLEMICMVMGSQTLFPIFPV